MLVISDDELVYLYIDPVERYCIWLGVRASSEVIAMSVYPQVLITTQYW